MCLQMRNLSKIGKQGDMILEIRNGEFKDKIEEFDFDVVSLLNTGRTNKGA